MATSPGACGAVPGDPADRGLPGGPPPALTPEELEARLREPAKLTDAELLDALEALDRLSFDPDWDDPDDEPRGDPLGGEADGGNPGWAPDDEEGDLDGSDDPARPAVPDVWEAGFTHRYPVDGATGFRAGGPLDAMLPSADLAWHLAAARQRGLGALTDDELCGLIAASKRAESWQAELGLAAVSELDARRAGPDGREGAHVDDELAALLALTGRAAQAQLDLARQLDRLPCTRALLAAGIIDRPRALVITSHLALLPDPEAAAVDAQVAARAGQQTTGQLGQACHRAVLAHDPLAYARRKKQAEKNARVECWAEASGTAAIAGRDLDRSVVVCADKNLDADARWLAAHGADATHDQLRAAAMSARLTSQPLTAFLPANPANPADPDPDPANPASPGAQFPGIAYPGGPAPDGGPGWLNGIHLTMPATAWLGLTERPGEIGGTGAAGPADAATCRQLAGTLARSPATRWCITLTDPDGRAVAHGCARAGPGPPGAGQRAWLARVTITPIETGTCSHASQTAGYRPAPKLRHKIKVRSPRCGFPGCRRPAWRCDDDHTIPHHKGGRTCECNLHPLCRHHHQCKQAQGWHLAQPRPGILIWTTPSGRHYTVTPEPYPV
jgi:hypothetical protein